MLTIADEATSALDATSRVTVFESIKRWRKDRTTIVITHDLSQIVSDDFVYVMKDGIVAEQGFRSDLMARGPMYGVFAAMAAEQAVQPVPEKHEEYAEYDMEYLDFSEDRRQSFFARPVSRIGTIGPQLRPASTAYLGLLDDYHRGSRMSVVGGDEKGKLGRPLSIAQKRLSWAPPRPVSRVSYISRPSYEGTPPAISIRRPSFAADSTRPRSGWEKDLRPVSALSYRHNASRSSHYVDADSKDLDISVDSPTADATAPEPPKKTIGVFKILATHIPRLPSKPLLICGVIAAIGHGVCTPFWSNYLANLMDIVGQGGTSPTLTRNALIVLSLAFGQGISDLIQDYTLFALASKWTAGLRMQTFNKLIAQDKSFFDESRNAPSALMQHLIKDIDDMRNLIAQVISKFIVFVVMVGMGIIWAVVIQWRLTLIGLAVGPVLGLVVVINEMLVGRAEVRNKVKREAVAKTFYEVSLPFIRSILGVPHADLPQSIANIRGIRAMALDSTFRDKFQTDAASAKYLGSRDAWVIATGAAMSAGIPLFIQGTSHPLQLLRQSIDLQLQH